jgi:hypothetical protein
MILHRWISVASDLKFDARRDLDDSRVQVALKVCLQRFGDDMSDS